MSAWHYVDTSSLSDPIQIQSIVIAPDPPKPGSDLKATIVARADREIEPGAYLDVTVKFGVVQVLHRTYDLFDPMDWSIDATAPLQKGDHTLGVVVRIPPTVAHTRCVVQIRGYTVNDEEMASLDVRLDFT
ncbi:ML domain-containing protein [Nocardia sp. CDC160]|uniref:ML domain-containing protein n=1 Tax=Nocardia sp. CDC160 TaxID=3112166 RepID=UPI002DB98626|nr:ML domain-containing protein [Nocardia sp. CDC160]MEC3917455.1 ML domain-containing protein [Nocardia sp. CDC160]